MPPKKPVGNHKSNSKNPSDWTKYEFINWNLSDAQKEQFNAWYKSQGAEVFAEVESLLASGYKVSMAYDESNKCHLATLTCKEPTDPNYAYCLSSRGPDMWTALAICAFKTFELCTDCDWPKEQQARDFG